MKRKFRLAAALGLFLVLFAVLVYFLIPRDIPRMFLLAADPIDYDLLSTVPLVHSSLAEEISKPEHHHDRSTFISTFSLEEKLPELTQLASNLTGRRPPGANDSVVVYVHAHTLVYNPEDDQPRLLLTTPTFLRHSLSNWHESGVIDVRDVLQWLEDSPCRTKILVLDAGTLLTDGRLGVYDNNIAQVLEAELKSRSDRNLYVLVSHQGGQQSLAVSLHRNSIFTQAVQEALIGQAEVRNNDGDTELTLDELYRHVCVRVFDHLGEGEIRQTPRLIRGGQGALLTESEVPKAFICRYPPPPDPEPKPDPQQAAARRSNDRNPRWTSGTLAWQQGPSRWLAQAEGEPAAGGDQAAPPAAGGRNEGADGDADKEPDDPRFQTLNRIWELRDRLAMPPSQRKGIWSTIDFAPQQMQRLDQYLIGFQQRLLFNLSSAPSQPVLQSLESSLELLADHVEQDLPITEIPSKTTYAGVNLPDGNLVESWNQFLRQPATEAWRADLTDEGKAARDQLLKLNYALYYAPAAVRMYELRSEETHRASCHQLLTALGNATSEIRSFDSANGQILEIDRLPPQLTGTIQLAVERLDDLRRITPVDSTINNELGNSQMADILRLLAYLQTNLPLAKDRATIVDRLRRVSRNKLPDIRLIDPRAPYLAQVAAGDKSRLAPPDKVKALRSSFLEVAAQGMSLTAGRDPYIEIGRGVPAILPSESSLGESLAYQVRTRMLNWKDIPSSSTVGEVAPLPLRFPILERPPRLALPPGRGGPAIELDRKGERVPFTFVLEASDLAPQVVPFELEYDRELFDISFTRGQLVSGGTTYELNVDADGPVAIEGTLAAKLDREQYAKRISDQGPASSGTGQVHLIIPEQYRAVGQEGRAVLSASLPWAEEIEMVVQQTGAEGAGLFYGERVQLPLFANRTTELTFGLLNRSRIPRKVNVAFYPVVRPVNSVMPTGRIFSREYHLKRESGGAGTQSQEINDWWIRSYAQPRSRDGELFQPMAVAAELELPPIDQVPPPAVRGRGKIINTPIEANKFRKLVLAGPPGPAGPDGTPGPPGKLEGLDLTNGLLCVIEDPEHPTADGQPQRWVKWIELVPRLPSEYLESRVELVPEGNQMRLQIEISPKAEADAYPLATWDSMRLHGFIGRPQDLATVPIQASWDWRDAFATSELSATPVSQGSLSGNDGVIRLEALLNMPNRQGEIRTLLIDIVNQEETPTLYRAFRHIIDLENGRIDQQKSSGFELLRLDHYTPHRTGEEQPPEPTSLMIEHWNPDDLPLLLPTDITRLDLAYSISTDSNSFNYARQADPDRIDFALLERGSQLENARPGFAVSKFANRQFQAKLESASADGPVRILSTLGDFQLSLSARTNESFDGFLVAQIRSSNKENLAPLRIPVLIDKDPPQIDVRINPLEIPVNGEHTLTIPTSDAHSGIARLVVGQPGPNKGFLGETKTREALTGNIVPNANDPQLRNPVFKYPIRPSDFQWTAGSTYRLRMKAIDKAGLESEPVDFVIRVGPEKQETAATKPMAMPEMAIKVQVLFVNGRPATDPQYRPKLKELPLVPQLDADRKTWVFRSKMLEPGKEYTVSSSGRPVAGAPLSAETAVTATPVSEQVPTHQLQFK